MFSADDDLSSNRPHQRRAAIDYLKREVPFAAEVRFCHTVADAQRYIQAAGEMIASLRLADSTPRGFGMVPRPGHDHPGANPEALEDLVQRTARYFREREDEVFADV